jgi:UDP-N-acetylglucosamine 2-epimerase
MSRVFFDEMQIPEPDINLEVGSGSHAAQTAQMLGKLEQVMESNQPDCVLIYGDTNSTLAGAMAAAKLRAALAHVEAGLRSFNRAMPEETNRVLADHVSDYLFCPTQTAVDNLAREGITQGVSLVGDTMFDAVLQFGKIADRSTILDQLNLTPKEFLLATVHRAYNTDNPETLRGILTAFIELNQQIVFPVHPRTRERINQLGLAFADGAVKMIEPVGYLDMLMLERSARLILTDSGGMQKEAFFFGVPCVTLRPETEWTETVAAGWNVIAGVTPAGIYRAVNETVWPHDAPAQIFGDGAAAQKIVRHLADQIGK